jgi:hypothetical protein
VISFVAPRNLVGALRSNAFSGGTQPKRAFVFLDAMEQRSLPNLKAQVDVFGSISRQEEAKAIIRKEGHVS